MILNESTMAVVASIAASAGSAERFAAMRVPDTAHNMHKVAYYVGLEATARSREADRQVKVRREAEKAAETRTPSLLGCWINGKLRFQTRDHDELRAYAARHMDGARNFGNNVWVAPVGSFVDEKAAKAGKGKKARNG